MKKDAEAKNKKVFLLGTGFSADAGLPLMKALSDRVIDHLLFETSERELVEYYGKGKEYLTDLWSLILDDYEICKIVGHVNGKGKLKSVFPHLRNQIVVELYKSIYRFFQSGDSDEKVIKTYQEFLRSVKKEKGQIITLNWDLLIELVGLKSTPKISVFYEGLEDGSDDKISLTKIHGSMNFLAFEIFKELISRQPCFINQDKLKKGARVLLENHDKFLNWIRKIWPPFSLPESNYLMPPILQKNYLDCPYNLLSKNVVRILEEADEIYAIGIRFLKEDRFFSSLFRRGVVRGGSNKEGKTTFHIIDLEPPKVIENLHYHLDVDRYLKLDTKLVPRSFKRWVAAGMP